MAGKYDDILAGFASSPKPTNVATGKYGNILSSFQKSNPHPDPEKDPLNFERSSDYPPSRMTASLGDIPAAPFMAADIAGEKTAEGLGKRGYPVSGAVIGAGIQTAPYVLPVVRGAQLAGAGVKAGIGGIKGLAGKIKAIRNAPKVLEDALGEATQQFGTAETPAMVGNTARTGLESEQALNEALAQKLYGQVPNDVPVSTSRLSAKYKEIADELPPSLRNAIKKNIQLEANPIRPGNVGEFKGVTNDVPASEVLRKSSLVDSNGNPLSFKEEIPGRSEYGVSYSASPGEPTQLPPNTPPVSDLMKLRSKLGAASRAGGIDGYNAGQLNEELGADLSNIGAGEGPLGKMTNEAVNEPLGKATNYYREMMGQQGTPLYKKLATSKIEDIPDIIFKNGRTQDVLEARAALGEQGFQAAKKSFFNDLANSKDVGKTLAKYSQNNSDFLRTVFNTREQASLKTIADLQQKVEDAAKIVSRARMLLTGAGAAAVGGGIAAKAIKFGAAHHP